MENYCNEFEIRISNQGKEELIATRKWMIPRINEKIEVNVHGKRGLFVVKEVIYPEKGLPKIIIEWEFSPLDSEF